MTQDQALKIMKTGVNVYLTGSAGSGKTYLLNKYIAYLKEHDVPVAVTASTGIAATHMSGMTIHGWAGIGVREKLDPYDMEQLEEKQYLWKRFEQARVLVIDEVSMLHAHRLDMVDKVCRRFKRVEKPFGGLQVILCGDFFQLPPVTKGGDVNNRDMVIHSNVWKNMGLAICYIDEQHRQDDEQFTLLLNAIRDNNIDEGHMDMLQQRYLATLGDDIRPTKLYTHNKNVDVENNTELESLKTGARVYRMTTTGKDNIVEILKKSCLAQEVLSLKEGAEVMFIKNNFEEGYVNGTRGWVSGFTETGMPIVTTYTSKKQIPVSPATWAIEEDNKIKASLSQLPLRLAWAITIHKSQGMSLDHAEIDLTNTFTYGMGYVALSRVRTLSGIRLIGFNPNALAVDPEVLLYDKYLRTESNKNELLFADLTPQAQDEMEKTFIVQMGGTIDVTKTVDESGKAKKIPTLLKTLELVKDGKVIKQIADIRNITTGTVISHIEQIVKQYPDINFDHIKPEEKQIRLVSEVQKKLKPADKNKLTPIKIALEKSGVKLSFDDIRLTLLFCK
ncbi:MAG: AAA family ATPase [Minisyncoccia bacterium]